MRDSNKNNPIDSGAAKQQHFNTDLDRFGGQPGFLKPHRFLVIAPYWETSMGQLMKSLFETSEIAIQRSDAGWHVYARGAVALVLVLLVGFAVGTWIF